MTLLDRRRDREAKLSADEVRRLLHYDPETGAFTWRVRMSLRVRAGDRAGSKTSTGYVQIDVSKIPFRAHRLAWVIMTGAWPVYDLDHVNGDPSDNRFANLREATRSQNCANRAPHRNSKSGVKGVYWNAKLSKWQVSITRNGDQRHLGVFPLIDEAKAAYAKAASQLFGAFAKSA